MSHANTKADEIAIREMIHRQAARLSWTHDKAADWHSFADAFLPGAPMIASSRPPRLQSVDVFLERMKGLASGTLQTFQERALGSEVHIFGNVAVALVASETLENGSGINRDVSGYLLIKNGERWMIAAQAWDKEKPDQPIPAPLRAIR